MFLTQMISLGEDEARTMIESKGLARISCAAMKRQYKQLKLEPAQFRRFSAVLSILVFCGIEAFPVLANPPAKERASAHSRSRLGLKGSIGSALMGSQIRDELLERSKPQFAF